MSAPIVTLLTDFGREDGYVAAMKGVLVSRAPGATIVDLSHEVAPQSLRGAGRVLERAAPWFPPGTVHCVVVDPGVGTRRRIVALRARGQVFLAPDNGLLGYALRRRDIECAHAVTRRSLFLPRVSRTFHGRDVFAPVAAALAQGLPVERVGSGVPIDELELESWPRPRRRRVEGRLTIRGEVIEIDHFGNAVTNIERPARARLIDLELGGLRLGRLVRTYGAEQRGATVALVGSTERLEVAVVDGDAARTHGIVEGDPVETRWRIEDDGG